jgi:hypothetical protein
MNMNRPTITIEQKGLKKEVNPRQRMLSLVEKVMGTGSIVGGIAALIAILVLVIRWVFA